MRIQYTEVELLPDQGLLKNIERAGRVCYKSEDKITEDSAEKFVNMILGRHHHSVLEHGSVYLKFDKNPEPLRELPWCHIVTGEVEGKTSWYVYTNLRYLVETVPELAEAVMTNKLPEGTEFFTPELNDPYRRWSFRIIANFKISEQYVRHRVFSHSKESTRYCNYGKERLGEHLTFILPDQYRMELQNLSGELKSVEDAWHFFPDDKALAKRYYTDVFKRLDSVEGTPYLIRMDDISFRLHRYLSRCALAEMDYLNDIKDGTRPEDARDFLTMPTKTEQVMTGFKKDWKDLITKRSAPGVQTEARGIAISIKNRLKEAIFSSSNTKEMVVNEAMRDSIGAHGIAELRERLQRAAERHINGFNGRIRDPEIPPFPPIDAGIGDFARMGGPEEVLVRNVDANGNWEVV